MQEIWMSLHSIHSKIKHYFTSFIVDNPFMRRAFQDPTRYPRILDIVDLRPLRATLPASMLRDYSTRASLTPSCCLRRFDLLRNLFLITLLLDLFFFSFLDHHTGHPAHHDARILLYECVLDALQIFSSSFRSIGSLLPIDRRSTSLRSAKTSNRSAAKLICSFFLLGRRACYLTCR
jgi:hypothetical protein